MGSCIGRSPVALVILVCSVAGDEFVEEGVDGGEGAFDALEVAVPFVPGGAAGGDGLEVDGGGAEVAEDGAGTSVEEASAELEAEGGIEGGLDGGAVGEGEGGVEEGAGFWAARLAALKMFWLARALAFLGSWLGQ